MQHLRRTRWRLRGAWLWPSFMVATVADAVLVHQLPLAGDGTAWIPALLLVAGFNLAAVAVLGGLGGGWLRRRRPDLPRIVADDYAGTAALGLVAAIVLTIGIAHHPAVTASRHDFDAQRRQVQRWVSAFGDAEHRARLQDADTIELEDDLYRTCVPGRIARARLCLLVNTSVSPPSVVRDPNSESNSSISRPESFR